jgi:spermidine synthase
MINIKDNVTVSIVKSADAERLKALYRDAGWWHEDNDEKDPFLLDKIIKGSFCFALATIDDRYIGMGRAISDGVSDAYIQDVMVIKELRGQGIGNLIMDEIIFYLKKNNISWIGLIAEPQSVSFYQRYGFSNMKDYFPFLLKEANEA